jgi:hypothetical protein
MEIKKSKTKSFQLKTRIFNDILNLQMSINHSIGQQLAEKIYKSREYNELKNYNTLIFSSIDALRNEKEEEIKDWQQIGQLGIEIDEFNQKRFFWKQKLQNKFFGNEGEEIKL